MRGCIVIGMCQMEHGRAPMWPLRLRLNWCLCQMELRSRIPRRLSPMGRCDMRGPPAVGEGSRRLPTAAARLDRPVRRTVIRLYASPVGGHNGRKPPTEPPAVRPVGRPPRRGIASWSRRPSGPRHPRGCPSQRRRMANRIGYALTAHATRGAADPRSSPGGLHLLSRQVDIDVRLAVRVGPARGAVPQGHVRDLH